MKNHIALLTVILIISCSSPKNTYQSTVLELQAKKSFTESELKHWALMDYQKDTVPGVSLEKAYEELLIKQAYKKPILVAVIDTSFDNEHEDLKGCFWKNNEEIDNGLDDDDNGYVDDTEGWNFLGDRSGDFLLYENYEFVRIVRFYKSKYTSADTINLTKNELEVYRDFAKAEKVYNVKRGFVKETVENGKNLIKDYYAGLKKIRPFLKKDSLSLKSLNSLFEKHPEYEKEIESVKILFEYDMVIGDLEDDLLFYERLRDIYYNVDFDERGKVGDNPNDINDSIYGNNIINGRIDELDHGTMVTGVITANRNNGFGIRGVANNVQILPLTVAVNGQAHDKDVALAIRYAVNKGAKIINVTTIKEFSLHKEWVFDAIKYAASKDVLIVNAAGNDNRNLDKVKNYYPNDSDYESPEITGNFLQVGASSYDIKENLKLDVSNYGKQTVDLFAPGEEIYTTASNNRYEFVDGTSFAAPIVSGIAALIRSKHPTLTAPEVKEILMKSGTTYKVMVNIAEDDEEPNMVPFSSLSKSGKIVNAYNALLLAKQMAAKK